MLTIKKRFEKSVVFFLIALTFFTGCTPPGPRALLKGKRSLEQGKYPEAVKQLQAATSILTTNAQAWNYLGLAHHYAGHATNAFAAYQKALAIDHNLMEVHYNLGCLWLEQNRPDLAKTEFTAYTLREDKSVDGWVRLGTAQSRLARARERIDAREMAAAEKTFREALKRNPQSPEAWNGLGMTQAQLNRPRDAVQSFQSALRQRPGYRPAVLNLAIVLHEQNDSRGALQKYQEYLSLQPRGADWHAVQTTARSLEQELAGVARAPAVAPAPVVSQPVAPGPKPVTNATSRPPALPRTEAAPPAKPPPVPAATANVQAVRLPPEPVLKPAEDVTPAPRTQAGAVAPSTATTGATAQAESRGFLNRINPANLFRGDSSQTSAPSGGGESSGAVAQSGARVPRYSYRSPAKPRPGDQAAAERAFAEGVRAQGDSRFSEAIDAYQRAAEADPAYYDAYHNLGLATVQAGNLTQALNAFEMALAIRPDSLDARYNFALALKQANYPLDAVRELERILAAYPNDARAHLALANLHAQQLRQPAKAREHYLKVLDLSPDHPQAPTIREWLWANRR